MLWWYTTTVTVNPFCSSQYGDMLHDKERVSVIVLALDLKLLFFHQNKLYHAAITHAVKTMRDRGHEPRILDIGTGTGLLAMMAASAGARHITACEVRQALQQLQSLLLGIETNG